jgi:hypothetical protein
VVQLDIHVITLLELEHLFQVSTAMHASVPEGVSVLCDSQVVVNYDASLLEVLGALEQLISSCRGVPKL